MPDPINTRFTIRVYGILLNDRQEVLLSDERYLIHRFTKFPGGGLEYGEGTVDCLRREIREETGHDIEMIRHLYTTDFFQESKFHPGMQVISIYYLARFAGTPPGYPVTTEPLPLPEEEKGERFRWVPLARLSPEMMTLPIDKKVVGLLRLKNIEQGLKIEE